MPRRFTPGLAGGPPVRHAGENLPPLAMRGKSLVRTTLIAACGLLPLLIPLLVWLAWSQPTFWLLMAGGCAALLTLHAFLWRAPDEPL
jgi:hypothetical protein